MPTSGMSPRGADGVTVFRLNRRLAWPLLLLLAMPAAVTAWAVRTSGLTGRGLASVALLAVIALLFLPWLLRRVEVGPKGILSSTLLGRTFLPWGEVTRVTGVTFRGRCLIVVEGGRRRVMATDALGNFRHLVGYVIEHASRALIEPGVAPLLTAPGRVGRDSALLWTAAAAMALLMVLKLLNRL